MQKGKTMQYVAAGVQDVPNMRMRVRSNVQLPDAEVGAVYGLDRQPFYAGQVKEQRRYSPTVTLRGAAIFLCALFVFFGVLVGMKNARRAALAQKISEYEAAIAKTEKENLDLAVEVAQARDKARICYAASQNLGMTASSAATAERVTAPDTRPFEETNTALAENSPNAAPAGKISGSR